VDDLLTQEEITALLNMPPAALVRSGPDYTDLVELGGRVYGFDGERRRFAEVSLVFASDNVPDEAMKQIAMKRFNLKE